MSTPVAFRHIGVRDGFEVAWFMPPILRGGSTFVEEGAGHHIAYEITPGTAARRRRRSVH